MFGKGRKAKKEKKATLAKSSRSSSGGLLAKGSPLRGKLEGK
jgi:hypothetical protein